MSDNHDIPGRRTPRRAEPLQPDKPASGQDPQAEQSDSKDESDTAAKQKSQSEAALGNVREGYR